MLKIQKNNFFYNLVIIFFSGLSLSFIILNLIRPAGNIILSNFVFDYQVDYVRYFSIAQEFLQGNFSRIEYPPLATVIFTAVYNLTGNFISFAHFLPILLFSAFVLTLYFIRKLIKLILPTKYKDLWLLLFLPSSLFFTFNRYDIIPVLFLVIAIYYIYVHKKYLPSVLLGIVFSLKIFSILVFPLYIIYLWKKVSVKVILLEITCFIGTVGLIYLPILGYEALADFMKMIALHLGREDFYGSMFFIFAHFVNITKPILSLLIYKGLFFSLYILYMIFYLFKKIKNLNILLISVVGILILFNIGTAFYSPQWWLWYLPLLLLLVQSSKHLYLLIAYDLLNYMQYPFGFFFDPYSYFTIGIIVIRTVLLLYIFYEFIIKRLLFTYYPNVVDYRSNL